MTMPLWFSNLLFCSAQIIFLVLVAGFLPRLFQIRQPRVLLPYWRALLAVSLALPFFQPWHRLQNIGAMSIAPDLGRVNVTLQSTPAVAHWHFPAIQIIAQMIGVVILAGIAVRFVMLALGLLRLRQFRQASSPISSFAESAAVLEAISARVGACAEFRFSANVDSPVTFGFTAPVILLPERFSSMDARFQAAIACHELLHVRRRDWAHHLFEEILRAVFWIHPAFAWLIARVRLAREQVVDLEVIRLTNARKPYLEALLAFTTSRARPAAIPAPPFLVERQLAERVALMLEEVRMSRTRLIVSLMAISCCIALATILAVWAFPLKAAPLPSRDTNSRQQPNPTVPAPMLQRIQVNHHDFGESLNDAVLREEETRINQLPDRPTVETAIDQSRVDHMMKLLGSFWHDRGIEVVVEASLNPSPRSPRYAILDFDVYKQSPSASGINGGARSGVSGGISSGVAGGVSGSASRDIPTVDNNTIWTDTVKRGPMVRQVRGLGKLISPESSKNPVARVTLPEFMAKEVQLHQNVTVACEVVLPAMSTQGIVKGHVSSVSSEVANGMVSLDVSLNGPLPQVVAIDLPVDAIIDIEKLDNVLQIGRPVQAAANSTSSVFRISKDGTEAVRVNVKFGRSSVSTIEVLDGLKEGDKIILSDMSTYDNTERVHIK
jgi:beta-lactamase regulating signal transducer with metallopeptidase domain